MHSSLKVPPQHFSQVEVWTLTGPLQHLDSLLFHTFCCRSAAVFGIIVLLMSQFQPSFSCGTDGLTSDSRILWYPEEFMVDSMTARCPGVGADMLCLVSSKRAAVHYDQTSPLWSGLSKGHCSRSPALQT